jgi:hypothetical protein
MRNVMRIATSSLVLTGGLGLAGLGAAAVAEAEPIAPPPTYHWCPGEWWDPGWGDNWEGAVAMTTSTATVTRTTNGTGVATATTGRAALVTATTGRAALATTTTGKTGTPATMTTGKTGTLATMTTGKVGTLAAGVTGTEVM